MAFRFLCVSLCTDIKKGRRKRRDKVKKTRRETMIHPTRQMEKRRETKREAHGERGGCEGEETKELFLSDADG